MRVEEGKESTNKLVKKKGKIKSFAVVSPQENLFNEERKTKSVEFYFWKSLLVYSV